MPRRRDARRGPLPGATRRAERPLLFAAAVVACAALTLSPRAARATPGDGDAVAGTPDAGTPDAVDWRGLRRMDETGKSIKREPPPPSPITALVQSAPYRVHVASTDGQKVTITDAFTLERRRVFKAESVQGYAFSNDGHYLYVVHDGGKISSVEVRTARARTLGRAKLRAGESVVEVIGHGGRELEFVTVVIGRGPAWHVGQPCVRRPILRRVRVRRRPGGKPRVRIERGPHDLKPYRRRKVTSPNTRFVAELVGRAVISRSRMGSPESRLNRRPLLSGALALRWMRDSRGLLILARRPVGGGCHHLLGLQALRQPRAQRASWRRQHDWAVWTMPEDVQIVRGDLPHENPQIAPDGMRVLGHDGRGVVLIEPVARFRGHVALIAPPSTLWPAVRPGVRSLVPGVSRLRMAELHMEQGDLDAAREELSRRRAETPLGRDLKLDKAITRIEARLARLEAVRERRARGLGLSPNDLRSKTAAIPKPSTAEPRPTPAATPRSPPGA